MDVNKTITEGRLLTESIQASDTSGKFSRQSLRRSFGAAYWALLLAMGLPIIAVMFGAIRARQFQLTANPQWEQLIPFASRPTHASFTSSQTDGSRSTSRIPVQTASIRIEEVSSTDSICRSTIDTSITGSVSGSGSIGIPIRNESFLDSRIDLGSSNVQLTPSRRQSTVEHGSHEDFGLATTITASRLESQVKQVRQRVDQLSKRQSEHQAEDFQQQTQILEQQNQILHRETEVLNALNKGLNLSTWKAVAKSGAKIDLPDSSFHEPSNAEVSGGNSLGDDSIHIRRETGRDLGDVYTMDIQDADIRQFFNRLSEVARVSILPSPAIQGQISFHLHAVRLDAALKAIAKTHDYVCERERGIVTIRTTQEANRPKPQGGKLALKVDRATP